MEELEEPKEMNVNAVHNRSGERKWPCPTKRLVEFEKIFKHFGLLDTKSKFL